MRACLSSPLRRAQHPRRELDEHRSPDTARFSSWLSAFREFRSIGLDRYSILFNMSSDAAPAFPPASVPPAENDPVPASARAASSGAAVDATLRRVLAGAQARLDSDRARLREAGLLDAVGTPTTDRLPDDMAPGSASNVKTG